MGWQLLWDHASHLLQKVRDDGSDVLSITGQDFLEENLDTLKNNLQRLEKFYPAQLKGGESAGKNDEEVKTKTADLDHQGQSSPRGRESHLRRLGELLEDHILQRLMDLSFREDHAPRGSIAKAPPALGPLSRAS